jgi:hypothetical protein
MSSISTPSDVDLWWERPALYVEVAWTRGNARFSALLSVPLVGFAANTPCGLRRAKSSRAELIPTAGFDHLVRSQADDLASLDKIVVHSRWTDTKDIVPCLLYCTAVHPAGTGWAAVGVFAGFEQATLGLGTSWSVDQIETQVHPARMRLELEDPEFEPNPRKFVGHLLFHLGPPSFSGTRLGKPDIREAWLIEIDRLLEEPDWRCATAFLQHLLAERQPASGTETLPDPVLHPHASLVSEEEIP